MAENATTTSSAGYLGEKTPYPIRTSSEIRTDIADKKHLIDSIFDTILQLRDDTNRSRLLPNVIDLLGNIKDLQGEIKMLWHDLWKAKRFEKWLNKVVERTGKWVNESVWQEEEVVWEEAEG